MNEKQARKLTVGDKVTWGGDLDYRGKVTAVGHSGIEIILEEETPFWTPFWTYFDEEDEIEMLKQVA